MDAAGNLYGTTLRGGPFTQGVVFKLDTQGNQTVLYAFTGGADAGLIQDMAGNFYGTASAGGSANLGVLYKLDPSGHETVLYNFPGAGGPWNPQLGVVRDSQGNFYGVAAGGAPGYGVAYKVDPGGNGTVLHTFTGGEEEPYGLAIDPAGNLYGPPRREALCGKARSSCSTPLAMKPCSTTLPVS